MKRIKNYLPIFVILLLVCSIFSLHMKKQTDAQNTLIKENKQLKYELKQLQTQKQYEKNLQLQSEQKNGFYTFPKQEKIADELVRASDERFKKEWAMYLVKETKRFDIDPYLAFELLNIETGGTFDPELVGPKTKYGRAYGMSQFMKNTAPWIAEMAGLPYEEDLLFDPYYSMQLSLTYLDYLEDRYGNWDEALTAYHRGMNGMEVYKNTNGHAKSWYAEEIQTSALEYKPLASLQ